MGNTSYSFAAHSLYAWDVGFFSSVLLLFFLLAFVVMLVDCVKYSLAPCKAGRSQSRM